MTSTQTSDYLIVHECTNCLESDLHTRTLKCGRTLCHSCDIKMECPCLLCNVVLPPFRSKKDTCLLCRKPLVTGEIKMCQGCQEDRLASFSIWDLLINLTGRIFPSCIQSPWPKQMVFELPIYQGSIVGRMPPEKVINNPRQQRDHLSEISIPFDPKFTLYKTMGDRTQEEEDFTKRLSEVKDGTANEVIKRIRAKILSKPIV